MNRYDGMLYTQKEIIEIAEHNKGIARKAMLLGIYYNQIDSIEKMNFKVDIDTLVNKDISEVILKGLRDNINSVDFEYIISTLYYGIGYGKNWVYEHMSMNTIMYVVMDMVIDSTGKIYKDIAIGLLDLYDNEISFKAWCNDNILENAIIKGWYAVIGSHIEVGVLNNTLRDKVKQCLINKFIRLISSKYQSIHYTLYCYSYGLELKPAGKFDDSSELMEYTKFIIDNIKFMKYDKNELTYSVEDEYMQSLKLYDVNSTPDKADLRFISLDNKEVDLSVYIRYSSYSRYREYCYTLTLN